MGKGTSWLRKREEWELQEGISRESVAYDIADKQREETSGEIVLSDAQCSHGLREDNGVAVMVVTPAGIPLLRSRKKFFVRGKRCPTFWKLPRWRVPNQQLPASVAVRGIKEDLGLFVDISDLRMIVKEDRDIYEYFVYWGSSEAKLSRRREPTGKDIKLFSPVEMLNMSDFFPAHRCLVEAQLKSLYEASSRATAG